MKEGPWKTEELMEGKIVALKRNKLNIDDIAIMCVNLHIITTLID